VPEFKVGARFSGLGFPFDQLRARAGLNGYPLAVNPSMDALPASLTKAGKATSRLGQLLPLFHLFILVKVQHPYINFIKISVPLGLSFDLNKGHL
jgi:hypothetical protein